MSFPDEENNFQSFSHESKSKYDLNSKIMITAIISLSMVVIVVSLLHVYARCILRRQARRRVALRQLRIIANAHFHSNEVSNRGLDPAIIASLPKFVFKHGGGAKGVDSGETECSVCLCSLEDGEMARKLPNCGHIFHSECVDKWLYSQPTCPICRSEAEPRPGLAMQPEPREGAVGVPVPIGPTAPPLESAAAVAGTSRGSARFSGSSSSFRLGSFRSILSWDVSPKRIQFQHSAQEDFSEDLERQ